MRVFLAIALFSIIGFVGCNDQRVSELDRRVKVLEASVQQVQADQKKIADADSKRQSELQLCIFQADSKFQESLNGNGQKRRDGSYDVPIPVMAEMERQKHDQIEECKVLYGK